MKSAKQVREYVRRRALEDREVYLRYMRESDPSNQTVAQYARVSELAFLEVLNAFDTPHKTRLKMPKVPKRSKSR